MRTSEKNRPSENRQKKSGKVAVVGDKANSTKNEDNSPGRQSTRLRIKYPGPDGEKQLLSQVSHLLGIKRRNGKGRSRVDS